MAENFLHKHSEDLTTIYEGQSRPCVTPKMISFVYGYAQIYIYTIPSARTLFERIPLISAAKLSMDEKMAEVVNSGNLQDFGKTGKTWQA